MTRRKRTVVATRAVCDDFSPRPRRTRSARQPTGIAAVLAALPDRVLQAIEQFPLELIRLQCDRDKLSQIIALDRRFRGLTGCLNGRLRSGQGVAQTEIDATLKILDEILNKQRELRNQMCPLADAAYFAWLFRDISDAAMDRFLAPHRDN